MRLRNYAKTVDTEVLKQTIAQLNTESNYSALLDDILGSDAWLLDRSNLQRDMEGPASELKRAIFPNEALQEIKRNVSDQYWMKQLTKKEKPENEFILELGGMPQPARREARVPQERLQAYVRAGVQINPRQIAQQAVIQPQAAERGMNDLLQELAGGQVPPAAEPYRW